MHVKRHDVISRTAGIYTQYYIIFVNRTAKAYPIEIRINDGTNDISILVQQPFRVMVLLYGMINLLWKKMMI